jgi:chemotaxis protein methyltransferase CheR
MKGFDIVFCRNVLIYFDDPARKRFVSQLYDSLNHGGYLFIGHSESLHNISRAFKLVHFPGALGYKKE